MLASRAETAHPGRGNLVALKWLQAITVFAACGALEAWLVPVLKTWFDFPRPFVLLPPDMVHLIGPPESAPSLPSGHAAFSMAVAASLWPLANAPIRAGLVVFALWVGVSRVSVGVHFPADVLAGYVLSLASVWLLRIALKRLAPPLLS
jgi:membrane-associated phospholipid phosphatase